MQILLPEIYHSFDDAKESIIFRRVAMKGSLMADLRSRLFSNKTLFLNLLCIISQSLSI